MMQTIMARLRAIVRALSINDSATIDDWLLALAYGGGFVWIAHEVLTYTGFI